ncbi:hypothetical protein Glove_117g437 [Diversispora epigaea]|uniref:Uncharacterized protein n=1 Tax=Diversispora epigaea TaxID=1348612 RepID=A0A397JAH6_9GLOM|nr:hypothetical protein Glove_117g437 [Diversispora epigaea]
MIYSIFETLFRFLKKKFFNYIFHDHFDLIKKLADAELEASIYKMEGEIDSGNKRMIEQVKVDGREAIRSHPKASKLCSRKVYN